MKMAALVFNSLSLLREAFQFLKPFPTQTKYGIPLPPKCHLVISDEEVGDCPILIIGDVHGCFDELEELVTNAKRTVKDSNLFLVFVGDMLNKGPKNRETLTFIRDLNAKGMAAAVKGNHEESLLREYRSMKQDKDYSLPPKYKYLSAFTEEDFTYLQNLPYSLTIPKINSVIVHAGLLPGIPLQRQSLIDLCHMRNITFETSLLGCRPVAHSKPTIGVAWGTRWLGPQHVYYGHDARRGLQDLPHATGLDTSCVYGGSLTGMLINVEGTRQFVSVHAKQKYYEGTEY